MAKHPIPQTILTPIQPEAQREYPGRPDILSTSLDLCRRFGQILIEAGMTDVIDNIILSFVHMPPIIVGITLFTIGAIMCMIPESIIRRRHRRPR